MEAMWAKVTVAKDQTFGATLASRPLNSFTVSEYAGKFAISRRTAQEHVNKLVHAGKCNRVRAYEIDGQGHTSARWFYVLNN